MAPLPRDRLSVEVPFSIVGVDYTGELKIKMTYRSTRNRTGVFGDFHLFNNESSAFGGCSFK